jgi:hypothetical protein
MEPPKIPKKYLDEADKVYERPSLYRSSYAQRLALKNDPKYKNEYEKYLKSKEKSKDKTDGANRWFAEEWVNVREYLKGKKVDCGTFEETGLRPACRPLKRINKNTPITLPELLKKATNEEILAEIRKKEKNPDYIIKWKKLLD